MKKLVIALMAVVLPLCANAQNTNFFGTQTAKVKKVATDYTPYLQGAVPVVNGRVTFEKTISVPGKTKSAIYNALASWASARYIANVENGKWNEQTYFRNLEHAAVKEGNESAGKIVCQGNEELVFSSKILEKDVTQTEYTLTIDIKDGSVNAKITTIGYTYPFTSVAEHKLAEEVITDDECFTKSGKWIKAYRKFRVKTVNLANELFRQIEITANEAK